MRALDPQRPRVRLSTCLAALIASAALPACVSEAVYRDALREAQAARVEATQREQQSRFQQAQLAWLAEQLEKRSTTGADARATGELARAARDLSGWVQTVNASPECKSSPDTSASPAARPAPQKHPPLDRADPWSMPRQALTQKDRALRKDGMAAHPLDDEDPWASLRKPLDGDDPWGR